MHSLLQDVRYAARLLVRNPGFSIVAVLVLALGIGANTAVFSIVNAGPLQPIASDSAEVVGVYSRDRSLPDSYRSFSFDDFRDVQAARDLFSNVMAHTLTMTGASVGDSTRQSFVAVVSGDYFATLNVALQAGRTFSPDEERPGSDAPVVIVGHEFARKAGISPAEAIGRTVRLNARPYTVIGVAPEGFAGTMALVAPEFWLPTGVYGRVSDEMFRNGGNADLSNPKNRDLMLVGRLRPGVTAANAAPILATLSERLERARPVENRNRELMLQKLPRLSVSSSPQAEKGPAAASLLLIGMASLVLLIACLNLANMLLARGSARRKEIALRLAVGGTRARIVRQLLTEGLLLAGLGGTAGLLLAIWGTRLLTATLAPLLPMVLTFDSRPDGRVLAATMGFCVLSTLIAALGPAWRLTRPDVLPDLKEQLGDIAGGRRLSMRNLMVVGQVALSLALLTTAGLFMRGALKAGDADPGFALRGVLANISPTLAGYDEARGRAAVRGILDRVRSTPGISSASMAATVPFGNVREGRLVQKAGTPPAAQGQRAAGVEATYNVIGSGYFETLRLPVIRGRGFTLAEEESAGGAPVVVIDEPLARRLFGADHAVGQRVQFSPQDNQPSVIFEVVGVAAGVRDDMFDKAAEPHVYVPFGQNYRGNMHIHARLPGEGDAADTAMLATLRQEIRASDPVVPLLNVKTLREHRDGGIALWAVNTGARMFSVFGAVALLLAIVGIYGVKSYLVSKRTREIGIRMALGATGPDVLWLVLREGLALTLAGVAIGLVLSWAVGRLVSGMLYDVSPLDPVVFAAAPVLLTVAAMVASYIPARRATRVQPIRALRSQ